MVVAAGRRLIAASVVGLLVAGATHDATAVDASRQSSDKAPPGGGFVVAASSLRVAEVTVRVPKVACAKQHSATVAVGLFGDLRTGSTTSPWSLTVNAACKHGSVSYRAVHIDAVDKFAVLRVHPGDRVRLIESAPTEYEVDDLTSGEGAAVGSVSGPGKQPVFVSSLLIGARVKGGVSRRLHVHVLNTRINGHQLRKVAHHRQRQHNKLRRTLVEASKLRAGGAFTLTVARVPR